jgi:hypothetical protein
MLTAKEINELAEKTSDAYFASKYTSWRACVKMLANKGFNKFEIEAILRSKWTRWAADEAGNRTASSKDLANFVTSQTQDSVDKLVNETFPECAIVNKIPIIKEDVVVDTIKEIRKEYFLLSEAALNKISLVIQYVGRQEYNRGHKDGVECGYQIGKDE